MTLFRRAALALPIALARSSPLEAAHIEVRLIEEPRTVCSWSGL